MPRYNPSKLSPKTRKILFDEFCGAVLKLKNKKKANDFFSDLFSLTEFGMLARRLLAAKLLNDGVTHEDICNRLKMGADTIARIGKNLNNGIGYKLIIKRLK